MRIYDHTGQKYGTWTTISMFNENGKKKYLCRCDCGNERTVSSNHITRKMTCRKCKSILENNSHIFKKNGRITCLGYVHTKRGRHGLLVKCDCGTQYEMDCYSQFMSTFSCKKCRKGSYPGKRVGNSILILHLGNGNWKKKCDCGTIFIGALRKTNCGCIAKKKILDLAQKKIGTKYHYLTVKKIAGYKDGHIQLLIKCKCGNQFIRNNGHEFKSRSCGCELRAPVGDKAINATLKNCEVLSIRELHSSGLYSINQLSTMFEKSNSYILRIVNRHIWKHI